MPIGSPLQPPVFVRRKNWAWEAKHVLIRYWSEVCRRFGVELRVQTKLTLSVLLDHMGTDLKKTDLIGKCFLLNETLDKEAGKGERAIQSDVADLKDGKLIKRERPRAHRKANTYN